MGQQPRDHQTSLQPSQKGPAGRASIPGSIQLPEWESFALHDRQLLIRLIVQTARRQVRRGARQQADETGR